VVEIAALPTAAGVLVAGRTVSRIVAGGAFAYVAGGTLQDVGVVKFCAGPCDAGALVTASAVTGVVASRALIFVAGGAIRNACVGVCCTLPGAPCGLVAL